MTQHQNPQKGLSRREFLGIAWGISLIGLFGQAGAALLNFFKPRIQPGGFGGEVVAGNLEEFELGSVNYVQKGRFYIVRQDDGGVLAVWQQCTHLGCTVPWREEEGQFNCPCHSSLFNRQGVVTSGPAPRPLDLFPIEIQDGKLMVNTSISIERRGFDEFLKSIIQVEEFPCGRVKTTLRFLQLA